MQVVTAFYCACSINMHTNTLLSSHIMYIYVYYLGTRKEIQLVLWQPKLVDMCIKSVCKSNSSPFYNSMWQMCAISCVVMFYTKHIQNQHYRLYAFNSYIIEVAHFRHVINNKFSSAHTYQFAIFICIKFAFQVICCDFSTYCILNVILNQSESELIIYENNIK